MNYENPLRLVRQLKGAPLACLIALSLVRQPVTARFLCAATGYSTTSITVALEALELLGFVACNSHRSAWRLLAGVQQLPLAPDLLESPDHPVPDQENFDPSLEEDSIDFKIKDSSLSLDLRPDPKNLDPDRKNLDPDRENRESVRENHDPDAERILAATKGLFGERIYSLPGPVNRDLMLACIAETYCNRHKLAHPARAAYSNLRKGNQPDEKFQDYRAYLPESFLADCGLLPDPPSSGWDPDPFPELEPDPDDPAAEPEADPPPTREPDPSLLRPVGDGRPTAQAAWRSALAQLELEIPRGVYADYVEPAWLSRYDPQGRIFTFEASNRYARDWLESRLSSTLTRLLTAICNQTVSVRFTLEN